ncbi:hypothetical protein DM806_21670 [Sphingobium lactosutens]|uniref:hypothetical protein n=1 Tax=Sphingobium lactosutens TaxID=522773 RepID=UPI0015B8987C|nr:hypothetical protein [Sphingobium lactosutens]NWK98224.1 hypothetical protein [Sphingobium lactosutens]
MASTRAGNSRRGIDRFRAGDLAPVLRIDNSELTCLPYGEDATQTARNDLKISYRHEPGPQLRPSAIATITAPVPADFPAREHEHVPAVTSLRSRERSVIRHLLAPDAIFHHEKLLWRISPDDQQKGCGGVTDTRERIEPDPILARLEILFIPDKLEADQQVHAGVNISPQSARKRIPPAPLANKIAETGAPPSLSNVASTRGIYRLQGDRLDYPGIRRIRIERDGRKVIHPLRPFQSSTLARQAA